MSPPFVYVPIFSIWSYPYSIFVNWINSFPSFSSFTLAFHVLWGLIPTSSETFRIPVRFSVLVAFFFQFQRLIRFRPLTELPNQKLLFCPRFPCTNSRSLIQRYILGVTTAHIQFYWTLFTVHVTSIEEPMRFLTRPQKLDGLANENRKLIINSDLQPRVFVRGDSIPTLLEAGNFQKSWEREKFPLFISKNETANHFVR